MPMPQYVNKRCPLCGGYVLLLTNGDEVCKDCHYVLPNSNWVYSSTSTSSVMANCPYCNAKMTYNKENNSWLCVACGYHSKVTTGDPPKDLDNIWKSDGVANAWGALGLKPNTLTITKCEKFKVQLREIGVEFELDADKLENIDTIVINGYKYVKEEQ